MRDPILRAGDSVASRKTSWLRGMGMVAWLNSSLGNRLGIAPRLGYRKTSRMWVGFLPETWVSVFLCDRYNAQRNRPALERQRKSRYALTMLLTLSLHMGQKCILDNNEALCILLAHL